jgi:hypothetical protein
MEKILLLKEKLKKINSFVDSFDNNEISKIERDILLQNIREFYLDVYDLQSYSSYFTQPVVEQQPRLVSFENTAKIEVTQEIVEEEIILDFFDLESEKKDEIAINVPVFEEKVVVEIKEPVIQIPIIEDPKPIIETPIPPVVEVPKQPEVEVVKPSIVTEKKVVVEQASLFPGQTHETHIKTVGEQFNQNKTSINDRLGENSHNTQNTDITSRIGLKPISDIKAAIGIGDRFLFIRELFGGNNDAFEEAIFHLNSLTSFDDAHIYISQKYNWDESHQTVSTFVNIVKRKYL